MHNICPEPTHEQDFLQTKLKWHSYCKNFLLAIKKWIFLYENNLPKGISDSDKTALFYLACDFQFPRSSHMVRSRGKERNNFVLFKILSVAVSLTAKTWFTFQLFLITQWITGPCEDLHSSKLNWANQLGYLFCWPQTNPALDRNCLREESIFLKLLPAVVVLYFTASEKENLRTESYFLM